ncbi:MAG TPA: hypothetical protein GX524_01510 [Firmicutes bacterium]|nr:hypothetical protein [Bacillota bacterium]
MLPHRLMICGRGIWLGVLAITSTWGVALTSGGGYIPVVNAGIAKQGWNRE